LARKGFFLPPPLVRTLIQLISGKNIFGLQVKDSIISIIKGDFLFLVGREALLGKALNFHGPQKSYSFIFMKTLRNVEFTLTCVCKFQVGRLLLENCERFKKTQ
jgi:hypothetical protein